MVHWANGYQELGRCFIGPGAISSGYDIPTV